MKVKNNLADIYRKDVVQESKAMQKYIAYFDSMRVGSLYSYFTQEDINMIYRIAISPAMHCNMTEKYRAIGEIMAKRGFRLIGGGTNRRSYECIYDNRIVAKVATDRVGFVSNLRELNSQNVLKPFCNKIFEVSPCGSIAIAEKVVPIKTEAEFKKYCSDIFDIAFFKIRNNGIAMEDIGTRSMKNWGYRVGFGPVLLDYPSMYVADHKKRLCKGIVNGKLCCGTLDYDDGFNIIVCTECGKTYHASALAKIDGDNLKSLLDAVGYNHSNKTEGVGKMKIRIKDIETGVIVNEINCGGTSNHVDSTVSNVVVNNNTTTTKPAVKKEKKHKIKIMIKDKTETKEEASVINPTPVIIEKEQPKVVKTEDVKSEVVIPEVIDNNKITNNFINTFNRLNSGINYTVIERDSSDKHVTITELAKAINDMIISKNPFISVEDAFNMYQELSAATMDYKINYRVDLSNMKIAGTLLNRMLRKISNANERTDLFEVFYKLILNVKNTKTFFTSLINLWRTFITTLPFESISQDDGSDTSCVYLDVYNMYINIVDKALEDYRYNVLLSGNFTYNVSNILSIINAGISELKYMVLYPDEEIDEEMAENWITITVGKDFAEQHLCQQTKIETVKEEVIPEPEEEKKLSPAEQFDASVSGNISRMSNKQKNKYDGNGKKKGKKGKKHR